MTPTSLSLDNSPPKGTTESPLSALQSSYIIRICQNIELAQVDAQAYHGEDFVKFGKKHLLARVVSKLESAKVEMLSLLQDSSKATLKENVIDSATVAQIAAVQHMMMDLPESEREAIEAFARGRWNAKTVKS